MKFDDLKKLDEAKREPTANLTLEFPFGACPVCHQVEGRANAGKSSVLYCTTHKVRWNIGFGHFSDCLDQTEEEQQAAWDAIGLDGFEEVVPWLVGMKAGA